MPTNNPRPSELLRRYKRNVYPPSLSEDEQGIVTTYLEEKGLKPSVGIVGEPGSKTQYLFKLAMSEMSYKQGLSVEDAVVGPNSLGMPSGISVWMPAALSEAEKV